MAVLRLRPGQGYWELQDIVNGTVWPTTLPVSLPVSQALIEIKSRRHGDMLVVDGDALRATWDDGLSA